MSKLRAYCFASGLIEFGDAIPDGALQIAWGRAKPLRDFIETVSRHGYRTELRDGQPTKIPGTDHLIVPGLPETPDQSAKLDKLHQWLALIRDSAPRGVEVHRGMPAPDMAEVQP